MEKSQVFYLQLWPLSQGLTLYFKLWIKHLYLGSLLGLLNSVRISVIFTSLHVPIPKFTPGWLGVAVRTLKSFLSPKRTTHHWVSPHCSSVLGDLPPGYNWLTQGGPSRITLCEVWNLEMDRCHGEECPNMRHLKGSPLLWCLLPLVSALHSSARFTSPFLLVSLPVPFCPFLTSCLDLAVAYSLVFLSVVSFLFSFITVLLLLLLPDQANRTLWSCHCTARRHLLDPHHSTFLWMNTCDSS